MTDGVQIQMVRLCKVLIFWLKIWKDKNISNYEIMAMVPQRMDDLLEGEMADGSLSASVLMT